MGLITIPAVAASTTSGFSFKIPVDTTADSLSATNAFPVGSYYIPTIDTANVDSVTLGATTKLSSQIPATITLATAAATVSTVPNRKWTVTPASGIVGSIYMASYLNGIYLIGNGSGKIATSTDGLTWTTRDSLFTSTVNGVAYGNSQYLAVGDNGYMRSSTNAITWVSRTSYGNDQKAVAFGAGVFCTVGSSGTMATSTDGVTWTSRNSAFTGSTIENIIYAESIFIATGSAGKMSTSTNGATWTVRTAPAITSETIKGLTHDGSTFYIFASSGKISASTDGITWTTRTSPISDYDFTSAAFTNGIIIAGYTNATNSVNIIGSTDGITWTTRNSNLGTATSKYPSKLAAGDGVFLNGTNSNDGSLALNLSRATADNAAFGKTETETFVTLIPVTEATGT